MLNGEELELTITSCQVSVSLPFPSPLLTSSDWNLSYPKLIQQTETLRVLLSLAPVAGEWRQYAMRQTHSINLGSLPPEIRK